MPSTVRLTPSHDSRVHLSAMMLVAVFILYAIATATAHAADSSTAACAPDSAGIARPAAARDAARDALARDADQAPQQFKVPGEVLLCLHPAIKQEPLRDLLDKYAPSAIEWSRLPSVADRSDPKQQRRVVALELQ